MTRDKITFIAMSAKKKKDNNIQYYDLNDVSHGTDRIVQ